MKKRIPNDIIIKEDYAILLLRRRDKTVEEVFIDLDDIEKVTKYTWCCHLHRGYKRVCRNTDSKQITLCNYILDFTPSDYVIDHINRNALDNRKCNLRIIHKSENRYNISHRNKYRYIRFLKDRQRYRVEIRFNRVRIYDKTFVDLKEAIVQRNTFLENNKEIYPYYNNYKEELENDIICD